MKKIKGTFGAAFGLAVMVGSLLLSSVSYAQTQVRDLDNPARQPFQTQVENTILTANIRNTIQLAGVPQGKRLVIEHVSLKVYGGIAPEVSAIFASLETLVNGLVGEHELIVNRVENRFQPPRGDVFVASQQMRAYADPGTAVSLKVELASQLNQVYLRRATISGYFVDVN